VQPTEAVLRKCFERLLFMEIIRFVDGGNAAAHAMNEFRPVLLVVSPQEIQLHFNTRRATYPGYVSQWLQRIQHHVDVDNSIVE
jgi:hypothetical protein